MKKVTILGHFAFGENVLNGQTIKTKIIADELERSLGQDAVCREDTSGGWRFLLLLPLVIWRILSRSQHVIIAPAYKAILLISPLLVFMNFFFHRKLHYVTIGGRLPLVLRKYMVMRWIARRFDAIYVETDLVCEELQEFTLQNVVVMPNCKPLSIVGRDEIIQWEKPPYRLCTFSRVMPEKGIAEAIEAVRLYNEQKGPVFELDIYGQVEDEEWFHRLMEGQPAVIRYKGCVDFAQTSRVLRHYFMMLFPTSYPGECFAGTLIDALAAGLPVLASDWRSNAELIEEGRTGFLFPVHDIEAMVKILGEAVQLPMRVQAMRVACIEKAWNYLPERVLQCLLQRLV